jgi:hypothetical protein
MNRKKADFARFYLPNVIVSTMKGTLNSLEDKMAKLLFKFSVEQAMMMRLDSKRVATDEVVHFVLV